MAEELFEMLQQDHEQVRSVLDDLSESSDSAEKSREKGLSQLKDLLLPHMQAEESAFYPRLQEHEEAREMALEALEEHHVAKNALRELEQTPVTNERWHARLTVLQELIEHHIEEEEGEIFDQASELFDEEELAEIAQQVKSEKESAKAGTMA